MSESWKVSCQTMKAGTKCLRQPATFQCSQRPTSIKTKIGEGGVRIPMIIADIAGVTASLPVNSDSVSLWQFPIQPGNQPPARDYNFSWFYRLVVDLGVTLRNADYKLNYQVDPITGPLQSWLDNEKMNFAR